MFSSFDHLIVVRVPMPSLPRVARGSRRVSLAHFGAQTRQIHTLVAFGGVFVGVKSKDFGGIVAVPTVGRLVHVSPRQVAWPST